jgi:hypothetical protein
MLRLLVLLSLLLALPAFAEAPKTFTAAKKIAWRLYAERPSTFLLPVRLQRQPGRFTQLRLHPA